jgi:glycosyltransferase involved in cell wall biosynthesis
VSEEVKPTDLPLITVGVVVLNREWIIDKMLNSLKLQTYPHDRVFVLIVDGGSKDKTVEIAQKILEKSDFKGYDIIVRKCNIPEGRNICIEKMQRDTLLFWDSDVIMEPNAIWELVKTMEKEKVDIVTAHASPIFANSTGELEAKINEAKKSNMRKSCIQEVPFAGMGHTLLSKNVLNVVQFDPELTVLEDCDFSVRARGMGFKIIRNKKIQTFDVNIIKKDHSDIHIDMPLKDAVRGISKKSRAQVLAHNFTLTFRDAIEFFFQSKRYIFYLGYIPTAIFTIYGIFFMNFYLLAVFPIYLSSFTLWQFKRRGFRRGIKAVLKSLVVGVPTSLYLVYYFIVYILRRKPQGSELK